MANDLANARAARGAAMVFLYHEEHHANDARIAPEALLTELLADLFAAAAARDIYVPAVVRVAMELQEKHDG